MTDLSVATPPYTLLQYVYCKTYINVCPFPLYDRSQGGYTPLHLAAMHNREEVAQLLMQTYNADSSLRDYSGRTAKQLFRDYALISAPNSKLPQLLAPGLSKQSKILNS